MLELGLNRPSQLAVLPHLERLLDLLGNALTDPDEGSNHTAFLAGITNYREALHRGNSAQLRESGEALLTACGQALERHREHRVTMQSEIAALVKVFEEVSLSVAGEGEAFSAEMTDAAARFATLGQITDIRLLKTRLSHEVIRLRDTVKVRDQRWQKVVSSFKDKVESLEEQLSATQQEASLDPLTGIANRRLFDQRLKALMKDSAHRFALVIIDVDDFKKINDQCGHEAGDRVLQGIANSFATSVRSEDMVSRIGGDEFTLILENVTLAQASRRVAGIVATLGATTLVEGVPPTTVSCGVAEFSAGDTSLSLTKRADEALYEAKRQGKGRVAQRSTPLIRDLRKR